MIAKDGSKASLLALIRRLGLIGLADRIYGAREVEKAQEANDAFRAKHPDLAMPSPSLIQRTYGVPTYEHFHRWGRQNAEDIRAAIERHRPGADPKVAEWGCGLGRICRHLASDYDFWGFDIDPSSLEWCRENLPGRYIRNGKMPPLPMAEEAFDVVYAVSIFTHLSAAQHTAWRDEIKRVLKKGGVFLFTVHGEGQTEGLSPTERERFDRGELVVRGGVSRGSRTYLAYHPESYVRSVLAEGFELLEGPTASCGQTLYAVRKNC